MKISIFTCIGQKSVGSCPDLCKLGIDPSIWAWIDQSVIRHRSGLNSSHTSGRNRSAISHGSVIDHSKCCIDRFKDCTFEYKRFDSKNELYVPEH